MMIVVSTLKTQEADYSNDETLFNVGFYGQGYNIYCQVFLLNWISQGLAMVMPLEGLKPRHAENMMFQLIWKTPKGVQLKQ